MFNVHVLNVWQGSTHLIELPNWETMLIDYNQQEKFVDIKWYLKKYLKKDINWKYILNYLVLTHPHKDHIKWLKDFIEDKNFTVWEIWESGHRTRDDDVDYKNYVDIMNNQAYSITKIWAKSEPFKQIDNIKIYTFAPSSYLNENDSDNMKDAIHNRCMVIKIEYNWKGVMFTWDSDYLSWKDRIVPEYWEKNWNLLKSDLIIASHHWSRNFFMDKEDSDSYTKMMDLINPKICIVSVWKENDYWHPHKEAEEIYKKYCSNYYTTKDNCDDNNHSIIVNMDKLLINDNLNSFSNIKQIHPNEIVPIKVSKPYCKIY